VLRKGSGLHNVLEVGGGHHRGCLDEAHHMAKVRHREKVRRRERVRRKVMVEQLRRAIVLHMRQVEVRHRHQGEAHRRHQGEEHHRHRVEEHHMLQGEERRMHLVGDHRRDWLGMGYHKANPGHGSPSLGWRGLMLREWAFQEQRWQVWAWGVLIQVWAFRAFRAFLLLLLLACQRTGVEDDRRDDPIASCPRRFL